MFVFRWRAAPVALGVLLASLGFAWGRTVSVPDLHGDFERAVQILVHAGLVDQKTQAWTGGTTSLVQTGDIVDRGDDAKKLYELFFRLADEAHAAGGQVVNLMGNHELMNLQEDLRYVSPGDYREFGGRAPRSEAWAVDGWLGSRVRKFPAVAKVGNALFSHAGLPSKFVAHGQSVEDVNRGLAQAVSSLPSLLQARGEDGIDSASFLDNDGPLWNRFYVQDNEKQLCASVEEVLQHTGTLRMVIGHTIQYSRDKGFAVNTQCGGRLVLADTAISRAYNGELSYIEHDGNGGAVAVYPRLDKRETLPEVPHDDIASGKDVSL